MNRIFVSPFGFRPGMNPRSAVATNEAVRDRHVEPSFFARSPVLRTQDRQRFRVDSRFTIQDFRFSPGGHLVEYGPTHRIFEDPQDQRTKEYLRGEFT
jgi:hypothetical protein